MKYLFLGLIFIHRKFITLLDFGSCRFYPSCSQYAKISIKHNNLLKALYYVVKRLLKCNQYFIGGIDYPIVSADILCKKDYTTRDKAPSKANIKAWLIYTNSKKTRIILDFKFHIKRTKYE